MKPFLLLLLPVLFGISISGQESPNILLIVSDDMGYSDIGSFGGEIETPALDALAENGLRLANYYVQNMCWPTRASIMTGLYPNSSLADGSVTGGLNPEATLLPEALKSAGYGTYMAGKWHLSDPAQPNGPSAPHNRGFDSSYSTYWGTSDFFAPVDLNLNGEDREFEWRGNPDFYYTDSITDYSLRFLEEHKRLPEEKPFFLYVAFNAAHWPLHAKPEDIKRYEGRYSMGWDTLRQHRYQSMLELGIIDTSFELSPRHPDVPAWNDEPYQDWQERRMEVYAAQVTSMDRNIGRIIDRLETMGELDNTIVIYQHDNGGCHVEYPPERTGSWTRAFTTDGKRAPITPGNIPHVMPGPQSSWQSYGHGWANASNTPFRLYKQHDHEGGTRSPFIISWPDGLDPNHTGGLNREICHVIDLMPTLLEAAGVSKIKQQPLPLEGRSFLPIITGERQSLPGNRALFWAHNKGKAARVGDWKLVSESRRHWELYNLADDPTELKNLAETMPEKVKELSQKHREWVERTNLSGKRM